MILTVVFRGLSQLLAQVEFSFFVLHLVVGVLLFDYFLVLVQLCCVLPELISFLDEFASLGLHFSQVYRQTLVVFSKQIDFGGELVAEFFIRGYVFNGIVENGELLLQELNAVV